MVFEVDVVSTGEPMTSPDFKRALELAAGMALSLGVRVFLYQDAKGDPVYRPIMPAHKDEGLKLVKEFAAPPRTVYEGALPMTPPPTEAA